MTRLLLILFMLCVGLSIAGMAVAQDQTIIVFAEATVVAPVDVPAVVPEVKVFIPDKPYLELKTPDLDNTTKWRLRPHRYRMVYRH